MMTVPMDRGTPKSKELVEQLFQKNHELDSRLRKAAQSKTPSDQNVWHQMRDNYEKIILADHDFSEKKEIEYNLWLLHYKKIEEYRSHINAAVSSSSAASQGGKNNVSADRIKRIKSNFRSFLSEATGFYHDLMQKIRSIYGLPLGYFSEGPENPVVPMKDDKRSSDLKKGLLSCHRCLIYLGDLARYKGLYGDGDAVSREYAAASSYYRQAASLYPSSGNPHHQLAILASYSSDDVMAVYRYFRSLAVDIPFSTARDNLVFAFERNRNSYSQLPSNTKVTSTRAAPPRSGGRGRGRGDARFLAKDANAEATALKEQEKSIPEILKTFCIRFVRLNGILFTKTSLETFGEVFSTVKTDLLALVSSGQEEKLNFGPDAGENALAIVRLIAILIFTVHNVKREPESQSYAEIVQRAVLLQDAFTAAFEFVGHILKRCVELRDVASSFFLPAILVYIEWLTCHPDIAAPSEIEEKQASARSFFWNQCIPFMNKLILTGLASVDGDDSESCFFNMGKYDEGETSNMLALWEDIELRGFLPLAPAHVILDFSSKIFGNDGSSKEKKARVQRILAAGKALANIVQVDQLRIYFDPSAKKFVLSAVPPALEETSADIGSFDALESTVRPDYLVESRIGAGVQQTKPANLGQVHAKVQTYTEVDEDEEIVFQPTVAEKLPRVASVPPVNEFIQSAQMPADGRAANATVLNDTATMTNDYMLSNHTVQMSAGAWAANNARHVAPSDSSRTTAQEFIRPLHVPASSWSGNIAASVGSQNEIQMPMPSSNVVSDLHTSVAPMNGIQMSVFPNIVSDLLTSAPLNGIQRPVFSNAVSDMRTSATGFPPPYSGADTSRWLLEQDILRNGMRNFNLSGHGMLEQKFQGGSNGLQTAPFVPMFTESGFTGMSSFHNHMNAPQATIPSPLDSVVPSGASSETVKFMETVPPVQKKNPVSRPIRHPGPPPGFSHVGSKRSDDSAAPVKKDPQPQADDYSWLDGYKGVTAGNHMNHMGMGFMYPNVTTSNGNAFDSTTSFPFPGKQISGVNNQFANKDWPDFQLFESATQYQQQNGQQGDQQHAMLGEQEAAQSIWSGRYPV